MITSKITQKAKLLHIIMSTLLCLESERQYNVQTRTNYVQTTAIKHNLKSANYEINTISNAQATKMIKKSQVMKLGLLFKMTTGSES